MIRTGLKLAAVDLDGTLLGSDGQISEVNWQALHALRDAGIQVTLASGRHYNNIRRFAANLPDIRWLISCQGGELSDTGREAVLHRTFLPDASARAALNLGHSLGLTSVAYGVEGVYTESDWNAGLEFYAELSGNPARQIPAQELLEQPIFKVIWIDDNGAKIDRAIAQLSGMTDAFQNVRTHQRLLEFMPMGVSKASALKIIAARLDLIPTEVIAFGDGENDVPMFDWAGTSVAMPHGWSAAIRKATCIAPDGPAESAFARGVDMILEGTSVKNPKLTKA